MPAARDDRPGAGRGPAAQRVGVLAIIVTAVLWGTTGTAASPNRSARLARRNDMLARTAMIRSPAPAARSLALSRSGDWAAIATHAATAAAGVTYTIKNESLSVQ